MDKITQNLCIKANNYDHRQKLCEILINEGYKVWIEAQELISLNYVDAKDYYVCAQKLVD